MTKLQVESSVIVGSNVRKGAETESLLKVVAGILSLNGGGLCQDKFHPTITYKI